jgi:surface-anchored protein
MPRLTIPIAAVFLLSLGISRALEPAVGHLEIDPIYDPATSTWEWRSQWFDDDLNERDDLIENLYFRGRDTAPSQGIRRDRPADSKWDFLGVPAGAPVWIFAANQAISPGFATTPPNLSGNLTFTLDRIDGPQGGVFSMYTGSAPTIHIRTDNGIGSSDVFQKPLQHTHVNWAFSKKGLWIIHLKVQGTLAATDQPTAESAPQPLVFAIGDYANWKASHFTLAELLEPNISGDHADPDGDGWSNLLEYALGGHPRIASATRIDDGQPLAPRLIAPTTPGDTWHLHFHRRMTGETAEIAYATETSPTLAADSWTSQKAVPEILSTHGTWQQVRVPLDFAEPQPPSAFARLKID